MAILIEVKRISKGQLDHEAGSMVYYPIKDALRKNLPVIIDFSGIETLTSSFLNTSFRLLSKDFEYEHLRRSITIKNSTATINRMIKDCISRSYGNQDKV